MRRLVRRGGALACCVGLLSACGGGTASPDATNTSAASSALVALGAQIFQDASLSSSGTQSCATCHVPANGHAPSNSLPAQLGGPDGLQQGLRATPSIRYLAQNSAFRFATDGTPTGGFFWDGRAASLAEQAGAPLLNPREMANANPAEVVQRLARAPYAEAFKAFFGPEVFKDTAGAFQGLTLALQAYQKDDATFAPFTSKYDAFLRAQTALSETELRGLALFNSPAKGNCAACHPSAKSADGRHPLFTDFSYDALGVPRNGALQANADAASFDLGLCNSAALSASVSDGVRQSLCGLFKVPSLRNVALRKAYFHNGRFSDLKEALTFYVQRDTQPEKWYLLPDGRVDRLPDGSVNKFNDLPVAYRRNVNVSEAPYNRALGGTPALSDAEIDDLLAFLQTLSDGWTP